MLIHNASWISMKGAASTVVPVFRKTFSCRRPIRAAVLEVTCDGVYEALLNSLCAVLDTIHGRIRSFWKYTEGGIRYEIDTPVRTEIILDGKSRIVEKGRYIL